MPRRMLLVALATFAVTLLLHPAFAEDPPLAADVTERGRDLDRILEMALAQESEGETRTILLLLDVTRSLGSASFAEPFAAALERSSSLASGGLRIGLLVVGEAQPRLRFTSAREDIVASVAQALAGPTENVKNVYESLRRGASLLSGADGKREILLVTLENGDAEDELESTASMLRRALVTVTVVAREAFLSDSWWHRRASTGPRGLEMEGPETAFLELPFGFLFQTQPINESVPAGFAIYGLNRIAADSGGRVYLYYPPSAGGSTCTTSGTCLFCATDHLDCGASYEAHRLRALSPLAGPRSDVFAAVGQDPFYGAILKAWERCTKEGIVFSRPAVKLSGRTLRPERRSSGNAVRLGSSLAFPSEAARADRLVGDLEKILTDLDEDRRRAEEEGGSDRYRAMAELTSLQLEINRINLLAFSVFCREVGPVLLAQAGRELLPPEHNPYPAGTDFTGISFSGMSLCHGVEPFLEIQLPGGEPMDAELRALAPRFRSFLERHAKTPFALALRQTQIARFHLAVRGKHVPPGPRHIPPSGSAGGVTTRPARGGAGGGGSGGPTSGSGGK